MSTEQSGVRGFFRVQIAEEGRVVGDSGWTENQIVNDGYRYTLVYALATQTYTPVTITHMALGTGGAPASNATTLAGEVVKRQAVTAASSNTSKAMQFTATFSSANSFVTDTRNVSNIGLFNSSATGTMFSGNTFASSSVATNQDVYCSYTISFS